MITRPIDNDPDVFVVWTVEDIDRSTYEALLCIDTEGTPDVIRGYDPRDGIFERPGRIVASIGGIDNPEGEYAREIEDDLYAEFQAQRDSAITRGES